MSGPAEKKNPSADSNPARNEAVAARRDNPDPSTLAAAMNQALAARAEFPIAAAYPSTTMVETEPGKPRYAVVAKPRGPHGLFLQVFPCWQDEQGQNWSDPHSVLAEYLRPHNETKEIVPTDLTRGPRFKSSCEP